MKVPPHQYDQTVAFYRDILGIEETGGSSGEAVGFMFGAHNLWIDTVAAMSQAELWLEIATDNTKEAAKNLRDAGSGRAVFRFSRQPKSARNVKRRRLMVAGCASTTSRRWRLVAENVPPGDRSVISCKSVQRATDGQRRRRIGTIQVV